MGLWGVIAVIIMKTTTSMDRAEITFLAAAFRRANSAVELRPPRGQTEQGDTVSLCIAHELFNNESRVGT